MAGVFIAIQKGKAEEGEKWFREFLARSQTLYSAARFMEENHVVCEIVLFLINVAWKQDLRNLGSGYFNSSKPSQHWLVAGCWTGWHGSVTCLPTSRERHQELNTRTTNILIFAFTLVLSDFYWNRKGQSPVILVAAKSQDFPVWDSI